jgi:hypothetical protein
MPPDLEFPSERSRCAPAWQPWLETAVLCGLALAAGALATGRYPAAACRGLAWIALAPTLAGLRYGATHGVVCGAVLAGVMLVAAPRGWAPAGASLAEIGLGWLVAGLVTGQFRDAWARRLRQSEGEASEMRERLGGLARSYHALKASHDRLQRETPGCPATLRDALEAFQRELGGWPRDGGVEDLGRRILALFQDHAAVRAATLHLTDRHGDAGPAVATLGAVGEELAAGGGERDPLVREAVRLGEVVSVRDLPTARDVVAAVPLVDVAGRVHAVVAVRDLPFLELQPDTLTLMAVLGAQAGDALARAPLPALQAAAARRGRLSIRATPGRRLEAPARENGLAP